MTSDLLSRLGVCSWSLRPTSPAHLLDQMKQIGLTRIQCALDPMRQEPKIWGDLGSRCADAGLTIVSGMFGTVGEDYSTLESIRKTGGLVPDRTWEQNWREIQESARIAQKLGLRLVAFHAGFVPHEAADPTRARLLERIRQVAQVFADLGMDLALETGQETADTLCAVLTELNLKNLGVNFDPANMILYDKGEPVAALRVLSPWLKHCHIKDATRTRTPGTWGTEVTVGTGEVNWSAFFRTLRELKFEGFCCLEREAGEQRIQDIRAGIQAIAQFTKEL